MTAVLVTLVAIFVIAACCHTAVHWHDRYTRR